MNTFGRYGAGGQRGQHGMGAIVALTTMGLVAPTDPTAGYPVSGDARQQAVNNPDQVRRDAGMLRMLDYPVPDTGNAYDPQFRAAVLAFQKKMGPAIVGDADGLIGPRTRAALEDATRALNSDGGGGGGLGLDVGPLPGPGPSPSPKPVGAGSSSGLKVAGIVAASAAAVGLGWWLLK